MKINWHIVYCRYDKNKILPSKYNPKKSGVYLCTCIIKSGELEHRYLHLMEYNAEKKYWHDVGRSSATSHNVLAWTSDVKCCDTNDFEMYLGYVFKPGEFRID